MRNLDAPVAASHRAYNMIVGLHEDDGTQLGAVTVTFSGFETLGMLTTVLEMLRTSEALIHAQAEVIASNPEEQAVLLAELQEKVASERVFHVDSMDVRMVDESAQIEADSNHYGDGIIDEVRYFLEDGREVNAEGDVIEQGADGPVADRETGKCERCDGCGHIADSDHGEPWSAWTSLPPGSNAAVVLGMVSPLLCPACEGSGKVPA